MSRGAVVAVTDQGHIRIEATVDRQGVEAIVKLDIYDIASEEFHARAGGPLSLAQARTVARLATLELDPHEWANFQNYVSIVNLRRHREQEAIAVEQGWVQNATERAIHQPPRHIPLARVDPIPKEPPIPHRHYLDGEAV